MEFKFRHDGKLYQFDTDSLSVVEARMVKQHAGMSVLEWHEGLQRMDVDAVVALVFTAKRRAGVELEWSDLDDMDLMGLMQTIADDNEIDLDAVTRGEVPPAVQAMLDRDARRVEARNRRNGAAAPAKRPAPRKAAAK